MMLNRPYRNKRVAKDREARATAVATKDIESREKELDNAHPSFRCRVCGKTGTGLVKVSLGPSYFLCHEHYEPIYTLVEMHIRSMRESCKSTPPLSGILSDEV